MTKCFEIGIEIEMKTIVAYEGSLNTGDRRQSGFASGLSLSRKFISMSQSVLIQSIENRASNCTYMLPRF